jgi:endonuclease-3 related protein
MPVQTDLRKAYQLMLARHGHLGWWPGETPFEVAVGAILTQNTAWTNVEKAITNLKRAGVLEPRPLFALPEPALARLIRPAGYFNVKARRLRNFLRVLVEDFDASLDRLLAGETVAVRDRLLAINGIGRETADSILLYAGGHHSFVIDAYTKRIFERHGWWREEQRAKRSTSNSQRATSKGNTPETYESLKALCEASLNHLPAARRLKYWRDYHAQLVMIGKHFCRPREPRCGDCPLKPLLPEFTARPRRRLPNGEQGT